MARTPMRRLSAAFMALWFTISMVDAGWLHACAMHSIRPVSEQQRSAATITASSDAHSAHHAAPHQHQAAESASDESSAPSHDTHQCDCVGACCAAQPAVVAFPCDLHELTRLVTPPVASPMVTRWVVASIDYRLPFATAPPTA